MRSATFEPGLMHVYKLWVAKSYFQKIGNDLYSIILSDSEFQIEAPLYIGLLFIIL